MAEVAKKKFKSKYHILWWVIILSLIFMGMVEYGYVSGGDVSNSSNFRDCDRSTRMYSLVCVFP